MTFLSVPSSGNFSLNPRTFSTESRLFQGFSSLYGLSSNTQKRLKSKNKQTKKKTPQTQKTENNKSQSERYHSCFSIVFVGWDSLAKKWPSCILVTYHYVPFSKPNLQKRQGQPVSNAPVPLTCSYLILIAPCEIWPLEFCFSMVSILQCLLPEGSISHA